MESSNYSLDRLAGDGAMGSFTTTHWSVVLEAGQANSPAAAEALERLCGAYWYPLYAYVRRQGHAPHDAQDLVQEFFARFLERSYFRLADRSRGRFRTFLLTSLKHFLVNEWRQANRQKRGGGRWPISIDDRDTEVRYMAELTDERSPEKEFERRWAKVLLGRVLDQVEAEFVAGTRGHLFGELKCFLTGEKSESCYDEIGRRHGLTEGSLKVMVHRLRRRYRELLRKEISITVDDPKLIDDEIRELKAALRS